MGDFSLVCLEPARITAAQIKAVVLTLKKLLPDLAKIIPRVFAHLPVTAKPSEVRMGKGKGSIAHKVARVRTNTVLFEIILGQKEATGESSLGASKLYLDALKAVGNKLPVLTRIVQRGF